MIKPFSCKNPTLPFGAIGHRGLAACAPENTCASFRAAKAAGLRWVEFDIQCCASGEWVIFHDFDLHRTSNGQGSLPDTPYSILKTLDVGSWFSPLFRGEKILCLQEALDLFHELELYPNIEIKLPIPPQSSVEHYHQIAFDLQTIIERHWPTPTPFLISSFQLEILKTLRQQNPSLPLGILLDAPLWTEFKHHLQFGWQTVQVDYPSLLSLLQQNSLPMTTAILYAYTVNDNDLADQLLSLGAQGVFTDRPEVVAHLHQCYTEAGRKE